MSFVFVVYSVLQSIGKYLMPCKGFVEYLCFSLCVRVFV